MNNKLKKIKILHCADFHLERKFSALEDKAKDRSMDQLKTFDRIIDLCSENSVEFLLIAGDLFDKIAVRDDLVSYVKERLESIKNTVVAISPGNHDPKSVDSYYNLTAWPENVYIFDGPLSCFTFEEKGVCLWGGGFTNSYAHDPLIPEIPDVSGDYINICVIHGDIVPTGQESPYNYLDKEMIAKLPFDYIALGHIHKRTPILLENNTYYAYSGTPEGKGFDEPGEQGVYVGDIGRGFNDLKFVKTCTRCYREIRLDITGCDSHAKILDKLIDRIENLGIADYSEDIYIIRLHGVLGDYFSLNVEALKNLLDEKLFYAKVFDDTGEMEDIREIASGENLKGIFARKILEEMDSVSENDVRSEILKKAFKYGIQAFEQEVLLDEAEKNTY